MKAATRAKMLEIAFEIISIHAAREGGDIAFFSAALSTLKISIHAAREGGDGGKRPLHVTMLISIHAAREGGDGIRRRFA